MKITLIFPPQWTPSYPHLALPSLTAFLRQEGYEVDQRDVNIEFYEKILTKKQLRFFYERLEAKFSNIEDKNTLPPSKTEMYRDMGKALISASYVVDKVENAKRMLRSETEFFNFEMYLMNNAIIKAGLSLISSAYYPTKFRLDSFSMEYRPNSYQQILAAVKDKKTNPFIEFYERYTIPSIFSKDPNLIGISISGIEQVFPGLTLASMVKQKDKNIHVTIGGNVFTRLIKEIPSNPILFSLFDSIITYEGENALLGLINHLVVSKTTFLLIWELFPNHQSS